MQLPALLPGRPSPTSAAPAAGVLAGGAAQIVSSGISLWAEADGLDDVVAWCAREHALLAHPAHVTLCYALPSEQRAREGWERLRAAAQGRAGPRLLPSHLKSGLSQLLGYGCCNLFILRSPELDALFQVAMAAMDWEYKRDSFASDPRVCLGYGRPELPAFPDGSLEQRLLARFPGLLERVFVVRRLSLWSTQGASWEWRRLAVIELSPPTAAALPAPAPAPTSPPPSRLAARAGASPGVLRVGLIADVQYCDRADGSNFARTALRRYRHALVCLEHAVQEWGSPGAACDLVVNLGDLIDIHNADTSAGAPASALAGASAGAFAATLGLLRQLPCSTAHVVGNHDLYNVSSKAQLLEVLGQDRSFFSRVLRGWRLVVLDTYCESVLAQGEGSGAEAAAQLLTRNNPNAWRDKGVDFLAGLDGVRRRFVPFNGALGAAQLQWLAAELAQAREAGEPVLVFSHCPLLPAACTPDCLAWDYDAALACLAESGALVLAVFAGHDHAGGSGLQTMPGGATIAHFTLPAAVEAASDRCHVTLECSIARRDGAAAQMTVEMHGCGCLPDMLLVATSSTTKTMSHEVAPM